MSTHAIHPPSTLGNPYVAAAERAIATQRTSKARRKWLKPLAGAERLAASAESSLLAHWMAGPPAPTPDPITAPPPAS